MREASHLVLGRQLHGRILRTWRWERPLYKFDVDALRPLAKKVCPTKAEVATPINYAEIAEDAKGCPGMNPLNQVQQV